MGEKFLYSKKIETKDGHRIQFDNDLIYYDRQGNIIEWLLYSDKLMDWFPQNLKTIEARFPRTYDDVCDLIRDQAIQDKADEVEHRLEYQSEETETQKQEESA
jgi:hypothetical protein